MIIKLRKDQIKGTSDFCGSYWKLLSGNEYAPNIVYFDNILPTTAHFHKSFDEIYFVLSGNITLKTFNPVAETINEFLLNETELAVIPKEIHHVILKASEKNRLCVITMPRFDKDDIHMSEQLSS